MPTTYEFQNTLHNTPAAMCAHIAYSYITADSYNDPEDVSVLLKRYTAEELADECIEEWNLHEQWLTERNITRADILHAIEHFVRYRPDQVFSDEELRESERDYQNDIDAKAQREDRAYGG
jgi:hypothetical protein